MCARNVGRHFAYVFSFALYHSAPRKIAIVPYFRDELMESEKGGVLPGAIAIKKWSKVKRPGPSH